jgi:hypothetical protein
MMSIAFTRVTSGKITLTETIALRYFSPDARNWPGLLFLPLP